MVKEVVGPSRRQVQRDSTVVVFGQRLDMEHSVHNGVSVQTGGEFSLEFLQDHATPGGVANIPDTDQVELKRGKFDVTQNGQAGYDDFSAIPVPRRMSSDCYNDSSDIALRKDCIMEVENRSNSNNVSPYYENGVDIKEPKKLFGEMNDYQAVSRPHIPTLDTPREPIPFGLRTSNSSRPGRIKFLCSFGGKILPRPSDEKLRYVGGETRIISIRKNLSWTELAKKTSEICKQPHTIKYQLPGEDLDALISVSSDEDLQNMLEEYQRIERVDGQRLRLFLISKSEPKSPSFKAMISEQCSSEYQYVVAVNGLVGPNPRKSSVGTLEQNLDGTYSPTSLHPKEFKDGVNPCGVHFQNWIPIRESDKPHLIVRNNSDLDCYSCERPMVKERAFHSEMLLPQAKNPVSLLSGSSDSVTSHHGMPHVLSESWLQEHGEKANHCSQEGNTPSPLDFPNTISPAWENSIALQKEGSKIPEIQNKLPDTKSTSTPKTFDLPKFSHILENSVRTENIHTSAHDLDGKSQTTNVMSNLIALDHDQESILINTVSSDALTLQDTAHQRLNVCTTKDYFSWSSSPKRNVDALQLDDLFVNYHNKNVDEVDPWGYPHKPSDLESHTFVNPEQVHKFGQEVQLESVIVEEATDCMPQDFESSSKVVAHVQDDDPLLTNADAENLSIEHECVEDEVDVRDKDESIRDAAVAETDANTYGLQIIRNADLEELRELGSGTFGTVYHGKWRGTDVAIKRIKKSCFSGRSSEEERLTKDFWREAHILSKLHHPNIVAFYGVVPDGSGGTLATVTEFMVNGSLRHVLFKKDRTLDRHKKLMIAMDAAFGMEYLHLKNIVHFDLKCDNLLVNLRDPQRPICKVADFGLSKIKRNTLVSGGVRGTLPWMAPELLNCGSLQVSEKVDVFSFGIAMWEILTGEEPYANMHCGAIIGGIMNNTLRPPIPDRCDPEWRKLMEQCWAAEPSMRPSFTEITNKLRFMSMALETRGSVK